MSNKIRTCQICFPSDEETKLIQESLYNKLNSLKKKQIFSEAQEEVEETGGFLRILKIIFNRKYKNFKQTMLCKHHHLKKEFANGLKCNFKHLDALSDKVSAITAKYNYHIDTISQQVKTFSRHFFSLSPVPLLTPQKTVKKQAVDKQVKKFRPQVYFQDNGDGKGQIGKNKFSQPEKIQQNFQINTSFVNPIPPFNQNFPSIFTPIHFSWGVPPQSLQKPKGQDNK